MNQPDPAWLAEQARRVFEADPLMRVHADFAFERLEKIGAGGMGVIDRVFDHRAGREAALKVLVASAEANPRMAERFIREARVTALLDHPSIPTVYEYGRSGRGELYILMQLVRGRTLAERIAELHRKGRPEAALFGLMRVLIRICEALSYAHEQGVIHRDVKPENVMIGRHGEVFLMDWGLARDRRESEEADTELRQSTTDLSPSIFDDKASVKGGVVGTYGYMAPEQAFSGQLGPRSDLFSIGAILYELMTGAPPVSGGVAAVVAALDGRIDFARARLKAPPAFIDLARSCLASEPDRRPQDAAEVAAQLRAALQVRGRRRSGPAPLLLTVLAAILFSFAAWIALGRAEEEARLAAKAEEEGQAIRDLRDEREGLNARAEALEAELSQASDVYVSYVKRGYAAFEARRFDQAIALFSEALNLAPNDGKVVAMRAKAFDEDRRYPEALADYKRAMELRPKSPELRFARAGVYNKQREPRRALQDLNAAIELRPGFFTYRLARAGVYVQLKESRRCLADLDAALAIKPRSLTTLLFRARVRNQLEDRAGAIEDYSAVLAADGANLEALAKRGLLRLLAGRYERAIADFDQVIEARPRSPQALSGRGLARLELGRFEEARQDFETFLAVAPENRQSVQVREWMKRLPAKR